MIIRGKQESTNAIAPAHCSPGDSGGQLSGSNRLEPCAGAEVKTGTCIHHDQYRPLSFFLKYFCVRFTGSSRDTPVHIADIVTGKIVA